MFKSRAEPPAKPKAGKPASPRPWSMGPPVSGDAPPAPAPDAPRLQFLDAASARHILSHLNAVGHVTVRVLGAHPEAGAEVVAFLRAEGYEVDSEVLERMVPPPLTRFALRYRGRDATLTVAPDVPA